MLHSSIVSGRQSTRTQRAGYVGRDAGGMLAMVLKLQRQRKEDHCVDDTSGLLQLCGQKTQQVLCQMD